MTAEDLVARLIERDSVVAGALVRGGPDGLVCDRANLERLLALARSAARPSLEPSPPAKLQLLVAALQGLARAPSTAPPQPQHVALAEALDPLFGYPLPAGLWETVVLPARVPDYKPAALDSLLRETPLVWMGAGKGRITFCLEGERSLWSRPSRQRRRFSRSIGAVLVLGPGGQDRTLDSRSDGQALGPRMGRPRHERRLRRGAAGRRHRVRSRKRRPADVGAGAATPPPALAARRGRRVGFARWLSSRPAGGAWRALPPADWPKDALAEAERDDALIYQLLDRYGVVFRAVFAGKRPTSRGAGCSAGCASSSSRAKWSEEPSSKGSTGPSSPRRPPSGSCAKGCRSRRCSG